MKELKDKIPEQFLDDEGYPTEEYLEFIKNYTYDVMPVLDFVRHILQDGWHFGDWGFKLHRKYRGKYKLELHTGGWSGNEETIREMLANIHFTHFTMRYEMWRAGGHYYFEIKEQ